LKPAVLDDASKNDETVFDYAIAARSGR